jgi:hypothetical protein
MAVLVPMALTLWRSAMGAGRQAFEGRLLYWTMPVVLLLWLAVGIWRLRAGKFSWSGFWRAKGAGIGFAGLLVALVFVACPPAMRVQFDETSLLGTSQNMHTERMAVMTTAAIPFDGGVMALESTVDKRPPLFAFLVSLVHDVAGYRVSNAFLVNAALLVLLLAVVQAAVRRRCGVSCGFAAPLLLVAVPLLGIVATSAGFELLAVLLLVVVLLAALDFVALPDAPRAAWLLASGLVMAQTRYESVLIFVALFALVTWRTRHAMQLDASCRWLLGAAPGLLTPLVFLFWNAQRPDFYPEAAGRPLVALQYGMDHTLPFLGAFFAPGLAHVFPGLAAWLTVAAFAARVARRRATIGDLIVLLPVLASLAISLLWFYGDVHEPTALRLFLPIALLGGIGLIAAKSAFDARQVGAVILVFAVVFASLRVFELQRQTVFPPLPRTRSIEAIDAVVASVPGDMRGTLWVSCEAQHRIVLGAAAMTPEAFLRHRADLAGLRSRGDLRTIFVITTPLDAEFAAQFGSAEQLVAQFGGELVVQAASDPSIRVYRLRM